MTGRLHPLAAADQLEKLPRPIAGSEKVTVLNLLAKALAAPATDPFQKLALLQGRPAELLRNPMLASELAALAGELVQLGQPETADALLAASGTPALPPMLPAMPASRPACSSVCSHEKAGGDGHCT